LQAVQRAAAFYYAGGTQKELESGIFESGEDLKVRKLYSMGNA